MELHRLCDDLNLDEDAFANAFNNITAEEIAKADASQIRVPAGFGSGD